MGDRLLVRFRKRWQGVMVLECLLPALGSAALGYLTSQSPWIAILMFLLALGIVLFFRRPWKLGMDRVVAHIDARVPEAAFSSGLLTKPEEGLTGLSRLQRYRVETQLGPVLPKLKPPNSLNISLPLTLGLVAIGLILHFGPWGFDGSSRPLGPQEQIGFKPLDSLIPQKDIPRLLRTTITLQPPNYTRLPRSETTDPNIRAVEGSILRWTLVFEGEPGSVHLDRMGEVFPLDRSDGGFSLELPLEGSGFYSFGFVDSQGHSHGSDLYSLEALPDAPPKIEVGDLPQYSYFDPRDQKIIGLRPRIGDDYGVTDAYIVATVSKGSGESVKFREEVIRFEGSFPVGAKGMELDRPLDLDILGMDPGDELYFHIVAVDNREPNPNISRSGTFFAHIRDSVADLFALEGGMGVDLLPQYFRSQRQLIIDTEKLIAQRSELSQGEFNFRSNELGFDQKSLRIKYGQFMGDETEALAAPGQVVPELDDHDHGEREEGETELLEGFLHDHDNDNEHNLLPGHSHGDEEEEESDPLSAFLHDHDDPEESTLFEQSLKDKLRAALNLMWDAELHLRLYDPERSLPYQYKILGMLDDIKNSARVYVHRIGFDPPPIKEDRRLSGDISGLVDTDRKRDFEYLPSFEASRETVARLEALRLGGKFTQEDRELFHRAGNELAQLAVEQPLKYLGTLQGLKDLDHVQNRVPETYGKVQGLLLSVIDPSQDNPGRKTDLLDQIDLLYLKELDAHE